MKKYSMELKEVLKLAYPVSIGQLGHILLGIEDSIMVGKVGAVPLAASSLVNGLVFLIVVFGLGMSLAITPLVAIASGRKDDEECDRIFGNGIALNFIFAILLLFLTYLLSDLIIYLNQTDAVAQAAVSYAKLISFSIVPFMIFLSVKQFMEGLSITKPAMYATILANVVNIFVNWLLIYGNWGFPALGLDGAGYATVVTRITLAVSVLTFILVSNQFKRFNLFRFKGKLKLDLFKQLLRIGIPTGLQHFFEIGAFSASAIMIGWLGSKALAAHQVALSMAAVSFMIILGIATAGTIRVGNAYGQEDLHSIRKSGYLTIVFGASVMALFGILFVLFKNLLPFLFISDVEVVTIAANLLIVAALFQISDGVQAVGLGVLRGIKDVRVPMWISFIAYWVIGLPVGYVMGFSFKMGVIGIWIGLLVGLTVAAIFFVIRFKIQTKSMERILSIS